MTGAGQGGIERMMNTDTTVYQSWVSISQAAVALERAVEARMRPWSLSYPQIGALYVLAQHDAQRMTDLARFLLQQTQTTTDLIDRLEARGYVRRIRHETDRRVVLVDLTDAGRAVLQEVDAHLKELQTTIFSTLEQSDLLQAVKTVCSIRDSAAAAAGIPADHLEYAYTRLHITAQTDGEPEQPAAV
jgi:DNA-binding MarR family transcriptional regulator